MYKFKTVKNRFAILLLSLTVAFSLIAAVLTATPAKAESSDQEAWYVTYLGGADTDYGEAIVVDSAGNAYIAGETQSTDFPTTSGAYQSSNAGGSYDIIYSKLDSSGSLVYSTYLGGSDSEYAYDIAVDSTGNAYIVGRTKSTDFPTTSGAYQTSSAGGSYDIILSKFGSSGSLVYSTYLGGNGYDYAYDITVDDAGNAYLTGRTKSTNFPVTAGAHQSSNAGDYDAFLSKFDSSGSLVYSTYLGGADSDTAEGSVSVDSSGNAYITGYTDSTDFPTTAGAYQTANAGGDDAFLCKFDSSGSLAYSTYFGGSDDELALGSVVDGTGNVYITGRTESTNFPISTGAYQSSNAGDYDAFLSKFDSSGSLAYSTYLGGANGEDAYDIAVDGTGNAYVTGRSESSDFPVTTGAFQTTKSGGYDGFLSKLDSNGDLTYSTYFGGSAYEYAYNIAVDNAGNPYITGRTKSTNFPVTTGAYQSSNAGDYDVFFARRAAPDAAFTASATSGANPLTVNFTDQSTLNPSSWAWDFDNDGTVDSTDQNPSHTYTAAGTYTVKLTVTNSAGSDEEIKTDYISVAESIPVAGFSADTTSGTASLTVTFTDQSTGNPTSWAWDFDNDGTADSTDQNPSYTYSTAGTYTVKLTATNSIGSDEEVKTDYISVTEPASTTGSSPVASFSADTTSGTTSLTVTFSDQSTGGPTSWAWDFDNDGTTDSTDQNPYYTYTTAGTYTVKLTATNSIGSDEEVKTDYISVTEPASTTGAAPVAEFTADTTSGTASLAVTFTDQSTGSPTSWEWDFDNDGTVDSTEQNPSHTYTTAGTYTVKLTATNTAGSDDEVKTDYITIQAASTETEEPEDSEEHSSASLGMIIGLVFAGMIVLAIPTWLIRRRISNQA